MRDMAVLVAAAASRPAAGALEPIDATRWTPPASHRNPTQVRGLEYPHRPARASRWLVRAAAFCPTGCLDLPGRVSGILVQEHLELTEAG